MATTLPVPERPESVFTYGAPRLLFGTGASDEVGHELAVLGARRVLVVTDPGVAATGAPQRVAEAMGRFGVDAHVWAGAHVEPTDASVTEAIRYAVESGPWYGFVAVGGGSAIDTAKAVDLLSTNPGTLLDYVNAPVGGGRAPERPLKPLVAVPTTTGTGSEATTICVLDVLDQHVKSGISHPALRPTVAVVDPDLTMTQPPEVTACAGMDILCHALESWTARAHTAYPRKAPHERVPYCGANPVSDLFSERALTLLAGAFRRAVHDGDRDARERMALAATFAGLGFGNAGVHVPHACAYPVAGRVREFRPAGYPTDEPLVPHGMAVSLTAPEAFRLTFDADPARHLAAARLLAPGADLPGPERDHLPGVLAAVMRDVGMPSGLAAVGYGPGDVPALVEGALRQQRLLATAPLPVREPELTTVVERSLHLW
jgi:alcohol dehydrogenase class IV